LAELEVVAAVAEDGHGRHEAHRLRDAARDEHGHHCDDASENEHDLRVRTCV
jgi:hypothetical protein